MPLQTIRARTQVAPAWATDSVGQLSEGLRVALGSYTHRRQLESGLRALLERSGLNPWVRISSCVSEGREALALQWEHADAFAGSLGVDTLDISIEDWCHCGTTGQPQQQLACETLLALLLAPESCHFPSLEELESAISMRVCMALAARRAQLEFRTASAERPTDCWTYDEDTGFTLRPGSSLVDALRKATEPELTGQMYSFSCYRATEYLTLLGIAEELQRVHPALYERLEQFWQRRAISSERFQAAFLRETGSLERPVPPRYYVPGDRVWFRNPDDASSDASGYEGSWTIYLGGGEFANFWHREQPFTLEAKCVEVYHWRDGLYRDAAGEPRIDEMCVAAGVRATLADPLAHSHVLQRMQRLRDPYGVYAEGGCIDASRESPRWVRPGTCTVQLPA